MSKQFFYRAMDNHGNVVQGQLDANNISDLETRLERMGLDLIHYHTQKTRYSHVGKVSRHDLINFCFYMETLTRAGVPLLEGLSDLRDSLPPSRLREVSSSLITNIEGGERLSEAVAHFPDIFNQVFVSLVHAGEESGNLSTIFQHLTETLKWHDEMIAKTKKLLMYPTFMGIVILGASFFLMLYLVPQLITFVKSVGAELPIHTQVLIFVSNLFVNYWYIILILPIILFFSIKTLIKISPSFHFFTDRLILKIWLIGPILEKIILARFTNFFALLYSSGITILDSLVISQTFANNKVIEEAIKQVHDYIAEGISISESFEKVRLFPPLILRMVKIGETTGELDAALRNASYFYNREVKEAIEKIQTLIEPIMTVILGLLLGWIMISVLGPIYDLITTFASAH